MGIKRVTTMLLALLLLATAQGWSAEVRGRSSTQLFWYNDFNNGRQVDLSESLLLNITNIDKEGKFAIYGYGRGAQNFGGGEGLTGRLYYLYGDLRDLYGVADLRLGRQFVNLAAGSTIIDGAKLDLSKMGPIGFTLLGGRDVIFGLDTELSKEGSYALGAATYLTGFRSTDLEFSYFVKWDDGEIAREQVGANFKQYLFDRFKIYGNARYDLIGEVFNEALAGIKYFPFASLVFTGEWYQSYATFDTTSIFSVFAVNRYQEGVVKADYTINDMISVNAGYIRQDFGADTAGNIYEVGCTLRPTGSITVDLAYDNRRNFGGSLHGGRVDAAIDATKELQLAGGVAVDAYERDFFPNTQGDQVAQKYWLGGKYKLAKNLRASLRLEDDINKTYNSNVQGRFILDYDF